jgi:hypothetical protein
MERFTRARWLLLAGAVVAVLGLAAEAAGLTERKLVDPDGAPFAHFGWSVDINGSIAIVGAPSFGGGSSGPGKAIVFERSGSDWLPVATLVPLPNSHRFGMSVAVSGDVILVGAPYNEEKVYVFGRTANVWLHVATFTGVLGDALGASVDVLGTRAAGGVPMASDTDAGAVLLASRQMGVWTEEAPIAGDPASKLGWSVSLFGSRALVGAPGFPLRATIPGAAYLYDVPVGSPSLVTRLFPPTLDHGGSFGDSVALAGGRAIVGAPNLTRPGISGAAYIFEEDAAGAWQRVKKLATVEQGSKADEFGASVAIEGNSLVVGVPGGKGNTSDSGVAWVYVRDSAGWHHSSVLQASDGAQLVAFGNSVARSGDCVIVGAPDDYPNAQFMSGSAYVFCDLPPQVSVTDIDVICCNEIPAPGAAQIAVQYGAVSEPVTISRSVKLLAPDGTLSTLVPLGLLDLVPGAANGDQFEISVAEDAGPGEYTILVEWTDENGEHTETASFAVTGVAVSAVGTGGMGLLALAVLSAAFAVGLRGAERSRGSRSPRRRSGRVCRRSS